MRFRLRPDQQLTPTLPQLYLFCCVQDAAVPARQFTLQLQQDLLISPVHIDSPNRMLLMEPQDGSPLHKGQPGAIPDDLVQHIPHRRLVLLR